MTQFSFFIFLAKTKVEFQDEINRLVRTPSDNAQFMGPVQVPYPWLKWSYPGVAKPTLCVSRIS